MILFISNINYLSGIENCKFLKFKDADKFYEMFRLNLNSFFKIFEHVVIDEMLIMNEERFNNINSLAKDKLAIFSMNSNAIYNCDNYIYKNSEVSLSEQVDKIIYKNEINIKIKENHSKLDNCKAGNTYKDEKESLLEEFKNLGDLSKKEKNIEKIAKRKRAEICKKDNEFDKNRSNKQIFFNDEPQISKITYDKNDREEKNKKLEVLMKGYKNTSHLNDSEIKKIMSKDYSPKSQTDSLYRFNKEKYIIENKKKKSIIKIPEISTLSLKNESTKKSNVIKKKSKNSTLKNLEIAVAGGLRGVGTTYCCFKIAENYYANLSVAYYQYYQNEIELSILKEAVKAGYISQNVTIYDCKDKLSAYRNNDIVIVDYGYFNRNDKSLLVDFERANEKYIVVNTAFNKFTSVNSAIQYSDESKVFKTVFNMTLETNLIKLQKDFKELDIICFEFSQLQGN